MSGCMARSLAHKHNTSVIFPRRSHTWRSSAPHSISTEGSRSPAIHDRGAEVEEQESETDGDPQGIRTNTHLRLSITKSWAARDATLSSITTIEAVLTDRRECFRRGLRHDCASRLYFDEGWTIYDVSILLGHADVTTTERYIGRTRRSVFTSLSRSA